MASLPRKVFPLCLAALVLWSNNSRLGMQNWLSRCSFNLKSSYDGWRIKVKHQPVKEKRNLFLWRCSSATQFNLYLTESAVKEENTALRSGPQVHFLRVQLVLQYSPQVPRLPVGVCTFARGKVCITAAMCLLIYLYSLAPYFVPFLCLGSFPTTSPSNLRDNRQLCVNMIRISPTRLACWQRVGLKS